MQFILGNDVLSWGNSSYNGKIGPQDAPFVCVLGQALGHSLEPHRSF